MTTFEHRLIKNIAAPCAALNQIENYQDFDFKTKPNID